MNINPFSIFTIEPYNSQLHKVLFIFILFATYTYSIVFSAWLSDDSFITLTQIVNFHNGDGMVFNFNERVQAFTHPTWFFLLALVTYITGEYYYTILLISMALSISAISIIFYYTYKNNNIQAAFIGLSILLFSKAFNDYTTSGLENPLSYFLFSILIYKVLSKSESIDNKVSLLGIYFTMALIFLNRMDYALILFPVALTLLRKYKKKNIRPIFIIGFVVILWFAFSLFYFGHLFPNTFYAKLGAGYPISEVIQRGLQYFQVQYNNDPITLVIITIGIIVGLLQKNIISAFSIGVILYLLYFFKSGGDFMQGRFFAIPVFISSFFIVSYLINKKIHFSVYIAVLILILITLKNSSPLMVGTNYSNTNLQMSIADERGFYYKQYGLLSPYKEWPYIVTFNKSKPSETQSVCGGLGSNGLSGRNDVFYIDQCALTDPLLSLIPAIANSNWRIGHQFRKIPMNYPKAVINNDIHIDDIKLDKLYQDIKAVSQGELFSTKRIKAIFNINFKNYKINKNLYQEPYDLTDIHNSPYLEVTPRKTISISDLSNVDNPGLPHNAKQCFQFGLYGISVDFNQSIITNKINLGLGSDDIYLILVYLENKVIKISKVNPTVVLKDKLSTKSLIFNKNITFDKINIFPLGGDNVFSIGYLSW